MKTTIQIVLALAALTVPLLSADPGADSPKLSVSLGKERSIALKAKPDGKLVLATKGNSGKATITARLEQTTDTPVVVKGDPTRPYLVVSNGFQKPIHFRVFAREKGSKKFIEVTEIDQPLRSGENRIVRCWISGSKVEQVTLSHFSFGK